MLSGYVLATHYWPLLIIEYVLFGQARTCSIENNYVLMGLIFSTIRKRV